MGALQSHVIYQIYPVSFKDTNQDGIGDLQGVINSLDYLSTLGVTMIWLTPIFTSPMHDNGYDVQDYTAINPMFGTLDEVKTLVKCAQAKGIGIMFDMVFNHTSTDHEWFQKALNGDPNYQDYYLFVKEKVNWESKFGGSAFKYVESLDMYYLHLFDQHQADLNWDNPKVRQHLAHIVQFWLDIGIQGFRFDVVNLISKPKPFVDDPTGDGRRIYSDGPHVHTYLHELNTKSFGKSDNVITVGEMSSTSIEHCIAYSQPARQELNMVFNFHHLKVDYIDNQKWTPSVFDFHKLKHLFNQWQTAMQNGGGWQALFWCNHDQPRIVSRFGHETTYHKQSAKMLATVVHCQRGTPFIYQGEEIGMTNAHFTSLSQYRDVESLNHVAILRQQGLSEAEVMAIVQARSRDNARTPMQWDTSLFAGFSDVTPWIEVNPNYSDINVEANLRDPDSILAYYQALIRLRKHSRIIQDGWYNPLLVDHPEVFAFERSLENDTISVYANFFEKHVTIELPSQSILILGNYPDVVISSTYTLRPYECLVLQHQHE